MAEKKKVLMVCLGNICRSPIAEAVFIDQIKRLNLTDKWEVDSAALIDCHTGSNPDSRAMLTLEEKGITNYVHNARPITESDFYTYDWIFGMDHDNIRQLNRIKPKDSSAKVELLTQYDPESEKKGKIIRDPYYDNNNKGFQRAFEQCNTSITEFLKQHNT